GIFGSRQGPVRLVLGDQLDLSQLDAGAVSGAMDQLEISPTDPADDPLGGAEVEDGAALGDGPQRLEPEAVGVVGNGGRELSLNRLPLRGGVLASLNHSVLT